VLVGRHLSSELQLEWQQYRPFQLAGIHLLQRQMAHPVGWTMP
jgi:hypothetical protein